VLARDRAGEKPLYYGWQGKTFLFGSELKALAPHPAWDASLDRDALTAYLRYGYVPAPWSIWRDIRKMLPGSLLIVPSTTRPGELPQPQSYWSARQIAESGTAAPLQLDDQTAADELDTCLRRATRLRMVADMPLGAFLSGGVDSSTIVALMQAQSSRPVRTFTIGFNERGFNEAEYAKAVARHLNTDHTEAYVTSKEAMDVIPLLPAMYDEPFSDVSQIPTYLVSRLARQHVTVALSGDAGDELFAGYNRYFELRALWSVVGRLPLAAQRLLANMLKALPIAAWDALSVVAKKRWRPPAFGDKIHKLADILPLQQPDKIYFSLVSQWKHPSDVVLGGQEPTPRLIDMMHEISLTDSTHRMMLADLLTYLPDDILTKVDRASMAVSLESRIPLLDPDVMTFAWKLPLSQKIRGRQGKWLLRQVLYRYVPRELIERPKMGFGVPLDKWLRGPLRHWAEDLLTEQRLAEDGWFDPVDIRTKWAEHLSGHRDWKYQLWAVLMFQAWLDNASSRMVRFPLTAAEEPLAPARA
jgi:asparagine synthase (glutamine-hydrolysing)